MRIHTWRLAAILTLVAGLWGVPQLTSDPHLATGRALAQVERVCAVSVVSVATGPGGGRNAGNPGVVLGGPEGTRAPFLSLGRGGTLVVLLGGDGVSADGTPGSDLFVYESGTQAEFVLVSVSTDGTTYVPVGSTGSQASGIDLDAVGFTPGTDYAYVQVQDETRVSRRRRMLPCLREFRLPQANRCRASSSSTGPSNCRSMASARAISRP